MDHVDLEFVPAEAIDEEERAGFQRVAGAALRDAPAGVTATFVLDGNVWVMRTFTFARGEPSGRPPLGESESAKWRNAMIDALRKAGKDVRLDLVPAERDEDATHRDGRTDLRQAIATAKDFLLSLAADRLVVGPITDIVLEEVNYTMAGHWLITLGYRIPSPVDSGLGASAALIAGLRGPRSEFFKTFTVHRLTGKVIGMSMREPRRD